VTARWKAERRPSPTGWGRPPLGLALLTLVMASVLGAAATASASIELRSSGLKPGFRAKIHDYTVGCATPTRLFVRAAGLTDAKIGRGEWFERSRRRSVQLVEGQAIKVAKRSGGRVVTYSIRCLPAEFPELNFRRRGEPLYGHYILIAPGGFAAPYVTVISEWGAPVWWRRVPIVQDAKVIGGQLVWATDWDGLTFNTSPNAAYEFRDPSGTLVRRLQTAGTTTDFHDLQPTQDGNYMLISYRPRSGVDTSAFNGDSDATVFDGVVQKLAPDGRLLWEWSTEGHVGLDETARWWPSLAEPYDIVHINAVEPLRGGDVLISLRHTDAVYRIDGATGEVEWKLGGTPTADSLTVVDDPYANMPLGGQHDVRFLGKGGISIFDNGTQLGRPPRAVRYRIEGGSARLVDEQEDPLVDNSVCCGSARYADGHWLVSWGGEPLISEFGRDDRRTFRIGLGEVGFSYRAVGVKSLGSRKLRAGMNAQVRPHR
jgi:Arylsulfotransferase (ASST)